MAQYIINKVTASKKGGLKIEYARKNDSGGYDDFIFSCPEEPRVQLYACMNECAPIAASVLGMTNEDAASIAVNSVKFIYDEATDSIGAMFSCVKKIPNYDDVYSIVTPTRFYEGRNATTMKFKNLTRVREVLGELSEEVVLYISGERQQVNMFSNTPTDEPPARKSKSEQKRLAAMKGEDFPALVQ